MAFLKFSIILIGKTNSISKEETKQFKKQYEGKIKRQQSTAPKWNEKCLQWFK